LPLKRNNLPQAMKHTAWGFSGSQTHSDRFQFGTEKVRGRCGLEVCRAGGGKISQIPAGRERTKNFNPRWTLRTQLCVQCIKYICTCSATIFMPKNCRGS